MALRDYPFTIALSFLGLFIGIVVVEVFTYYSNQSILGFVIGEISTQKDPRIINKFLWGALGAGIGSLIFGIPSYLIESTKKLSEDKQEVFY
jgi:hypothetical protein